MNQDSAAESDKLDELVGRCRAQIHGSLGAELPTLGLVLGSGFQNVLSGFKVLCEVSYSALAGFPRPQVAGHSGTLYLAELEGLRCVVCSGRAHFYEGYSMEAVMFPTRMLAECGVKELVLTNAAGGINPAYKPGDFMVFKDHINLMGANALRGAFVRPAFVDLTRAYSPALRRELLVVARRARVRAHGGVYVGVCGPTYETPAEIRAFRKLGADAVGMSTIPEVLMARARGLEVAAISCITNPAAGMRRKELSHEEVLQTGRENAEKALRWLTEFARRRVRQSSMPLKRHSRRKNLNKGARPVGSASNRR